MKLKGIFYSSYFYLACLLILWHVSYTLGWYSDLFFPSLQQVIEFLIDGFWKDCSLWGAIWISFKRLFIGYFISLILGIFLGMLCYSLPVFNLTLKKLALGFQTLPSICWVPLTLLWFGQTDVAIIFVIVMGSVWGLILGTDQSIQRVPEIYIKAAYTMGARKFTLWRTVIFPAAFPSMIVAMKQGWAFAWRSLLSAEIYISAVSGLGLGQLLHYGREMQAMDQVVSIILILITIGLLIEHCLFLPIEKNITKRWGR